MLENAVSGERSTGRGAQVPGLRIAGKTGTSDAEHVLASFVGIVPATAPEYVVYVGVQDPAGSGSGASVAAPAFARLATQLMSH
jgi:cell division protein FtsI (penicillin-binding protein 3)